MGRVVEQILIEASAMRTMYTLRVSPAQVKRNLAGIVSKMEGGRERERERKGRREGLLIQGKGREGCLVIRQQFLKPSVSPPRAFRFLLGEQSQLESRSEIFNLQSRLRHASRVMSEG